MKGSTSFLIRNLIVCLRLSARPVTFFITDVQIQINYSETVAISFDHKEATASGAVVLTPLRGCG